jgi:hypothetical protein
MREDQPVPSADGGTYGLSIWLQTRDEVERAIRALGTHPSFVQWYRDDVVAWPEVECRLESMFSEDQPGNVGYELSAWRGLCSLARLRTGQEIGAWLNVWHGSNEEGAPPYQSQVESFEFPVEIELYVYPYAHDHVPDADFDGWMVDIARTVYRSVPFRVAVIDFEITELYECALSRSEGVLREKDSELRWHPYASSESDT